MANRLMRASGLVVVLVAALVLGQGAAAQNVVAVKLDSVDASQYPKIVANATIIDENGFPVTGLTAPQFELTEDGKTSFPPDTVQAVKNDRAAVSVLILIDLSATLKGKPLQAAQEAAAKFLEKLLNEGNDPDRAAFIGFGQQVNIQAATLTEGPREVPFTNDAGRLLNVVNFVETEAKTGTPLYDAVYRAVKITAQQPGRRAILVMTDGADVGSTLKEDDPIDEARRQHIPVFTIGLSNSRLDKTYLARLAELTGGQFQEAPAPDQLGLKFEEVLSRIKIQYQLTYQTRLPADGQQHSLRLQVVTAHSRASDEARFKLGQAAPAATAPPATPAPPATALPQPTAAPLAPKGDEGMIQGILNWVSDNPFLAAGIAAAILVLAVLLIVFVVLLARRRGGAEPASDWGAAAAPAWPAAPTSPQPVAFPQSAAPTAGPAAPPTQQPAAPLPQPPVSAPPPAQAPAPGGTVVIQRGKPKVLGMLVGRKHTNARHQVEKTVTIGRAPTNTIVLDHPTVSRQHATIKLEKGEFRLYDLGSANGTFIGGAADKRLREPVTLQDGMVIRFGEVEFTFKLMPLQ